jgi:DNA-binding XRE family transcriptional regulator
MTQEEQVQLYIDLGIKIKKAREKAGFKQGVFSQMINLSRASVVNIEKGRQRPPLHLVFEIAKITGCDIFDILPKPEMNTDENLKVSWKNQIFKSARGDTKTKEKLTKFLNERSLNITKDETVSKKN